MNTSLILSLLLFCLVLSLVVWYFAKHKGHEAIKGAATFFAIGVVVSLITIFSSVSSATSDIEIWSGEITSKARDHGTYEESYQCNCRPGPQNCSGTGSNKSCSSTTVCDTCYRTHYTVNWNCKSTVGSFEIKSLDSLSSSVYREKDPQRWTVIAKGDPASKQNTYTNYVQAVPESLFRPPSQQLKSKFAHLIPAYPDKVYDFYKIDRFLSPGFSVPDALLWNKDISMMLRALGPTKQVNAIVVVAKTNDPNYEFALRDAWEGANKNDVVLVIGSAVWPKIDFVRVISWTKSELFKIELRDSIQDVGVVQREAIISLLESSIKKNFVRRQMKDFEFLESEISPPAWVLGTLVAVLCLLAFVCFGLVTDLFEKKTNLEYRNKRF